MTEPDENSDRRQVDEFKERLRVQIEQELERGVSPADLITGMTETLTILGIAMMGAPMTAWLFEHAASQVKRLAI